MSSIAESVLVQSLKARVQSLEAKVAALEAASARLRHELDNLAQLQILREQDAPTTLASRAKRPAAV